MDPFIGRNDLSKSSHLHGFTTFTGFWWYPQDGITTKASVGVFIHIPMASALAVSRQIIKNLRVSMDRDHRVDRVILLLEILRAMVCAETIKMVKVKLTSTNGFSLIIWCHPALFFFLVKSNAHLMSSGPHAVGEMSSSAPIPIFAYSLEALESEPPQGADFTSMGEDCESACACGNEPKCAKRIRRDHSLHTGLGTTI